MPWWDSANTRLVVEQLARVRGLGVEAARVDDWNYEAELVPSAAATTDVAAAAVRAIPEIDIRGELRPLRRVASSLKDLRMRMASALGHADSW